MVGTNRKLLYAAGLLMLASCAQPSSEASRIYRIVSISDDHLYRVQKMPRSSGLHLRSLTDEGEYYAVVYDNLDADSAGGGITIIIDKQSMKVSKWYGEQ